MNLSLVIENKWRTDRMCKNQRTIEKENIQKLVIVHATFMCGAILTVSAKKTYVHRTRTSDLGVLKIAYALPYKRYSEPLH